VLFRSLAHHARHRHRQHDAKSGAGDREAAAGTIGLAIAGAALGVVLSMSVTRVMRQVVFGTSLNDPLTLVLAALIVVGAACIAAILPAWRTLRMNVTAVLNST